MSEEQLKILQGVLNLGDDSVTFVTYMDGHWVLATITKDNGRFFHDTMCLHENWDEFVRLCAEYSDYVPGDSG